MKNSKSYFKLNPASFFVLGAVCGAIYNLDKGSIFALSKDGRVMIQKLDQGKSILCVCREEGISKKDLISFLEKLKDLGLGTFFSEYRKGKNIGLPVVSGNLSFLHCEITEQCNFACVHCYNSASPCKKKKEIGVAEWLGILQDAYEKGCRRVQFVGGEPFLRRKTLFAVAMEARRMGYESVEIYSNCSLLTARDIATIKDLGISMASSFYSNNEHIHDAITQKKGSWRVAVRNFKKLIEQQIPLRVGVVISSINEATLEETKTFLSEQIGVERVKVDYVRPAGRGCGSDLVSTSIIDAQIVTSPSFTKTDPVTFAKWRHGHNCFLDKACVSSSGDVHPCIMERNISYGNIREIPFREILELPSALRYRRMTKDNIEGCRECEFRYCCFDCRVKARNGSEDITAKPWWCGYDPLKGEWITDKKEVTEKSPM